jgi:hypothetical protein
MKILYVKKKYTVNIPEPDREQPPSLSEMPAVGCLLSDERP